MNEKISVIVPVYNVEKYLDKCIESIVNQTYKNLEIILVDDGSSDNCPAMCDEWAGKDKRIKVIHKENDGVSSARNAGLEAAAGDFIGFVDSDDYIEADMFKALMNAAAEKNADITACGFCYDFTDGSCKIISSNGGEYSGADIVKNLLLDRIRPECCSKLYKKELIGSTVFDQDHAYAEDLQFNFNVMLKAKKMVLVEQPFYHYLQNSGNSSTTSFITDARATSWKIFDGILQKCETDKTLKDAAVFRLTVFTFGILNRVIQVKAFRKKYFNEISNSLIRYKKEIMQNSLISKKHKCSLMLLAFNRYLYLAVYWLVFRF